MLKARRLREYNEKAVSDLIVRMPMTKWSGSAKEGLVSFEEGLFKLNLNYKNEGSDILYSWTSEVAEYRLHHYFERKSLN